MAWICVGVCMDGVREDGGGRDTKSTWLIVGLGNPGAEYAGTYHNAGFRVVERMAGRFGVAIDRPCGRALVSARFSIDGREAVLVLPQTYMNRVGQTLPGLFERFETSCGNVVAVYDDIALPLGKLRVRQKGSAGGHNGVKSLILACGSEEFPRVRVGILPEAPVGDVRDFVLSRVWKADRSRLERAEAAAAEAVETLIVDGAPAAMAKFNSLDLREE